MAKPSKRAERMWLRLTEWYGARVIDQYGADPPEDWCDVIDHLDNDQVKRGLSLLRSRYVQHPPTLPQFEAVMRPPPVPTGEPSPAEKLCAHATKVYGARMTPKQLRGPWTYLHDQDGQICGVAIDSDGVSAGYRVMVADIGLPNWLDASVAYATKQPMLPAAQRP